jgi:hypothetical protein
MPVSQDLLVHVALNVFQIKHAVDITQHQLKENVAPANQEDVHDSLDIIARSILRKMVLANIGFHIFSVAQSDVTDKVWIEAIRLTEAAGRGLIA